MNNRPRIYNREDQTSMYSASVLREIERAANRFENDGEKRKGKILLNAVQQAVEKNNDAYIRAIVTAKTIPVCIDEFLDGGDFLNGKADVWPALRPIIRESCPDIMMGADPIIEVINSSTIGSGKSVIGKVATAYVAYFLSCWNKPQLLFDSLNQYDPILITMQSISPEQTNSQLYEPFKSMFTEMKYSKKYLSWNRDRETTRIELSNNVQIRKMGANPLKVLGFGVIHAHLDEASFMEVTQESKKESARATNGMYDQAEQVYNGLYKRRISRFLTRGPNPGFIYLSSSVNYAEDFVDRRIKEVNKTKQKNTVLINFRQHDIKPTGFSGETFRFLVGTNDFPPRFLLDTDIEGRDYKAGAIVENVPIEYKNEFMRDPELAQRDLLGHPTSAISRFISKTDKLVNAIVMGRDYGLTPFVHKQNIISDKDMCLPRILEDKLPADRSKEFRYVHVDLSRTSDRVGIAMVKIPGYTNVIKGDLVELLPQFAVELSVTIQPSKINPISIPDIRAWVTQLKTFYGFNIRYVTFDGFDSQESMQLLRIAGIQSFKISMDDSVAPYDELRQAFYEDRVYMVDNDEVRLELASLELIISGNKRKVDHTKHMKKDGADAIAGAVRGANMDRLTRAKKKVTDESGQSVHNQQRRENIERR